MRHIYSFLGVIILCILLPIAAMGIDRAQVESYEQLTASITQSVGDTDTAVTLVELPHPNRSSAVSKITSTNGSDVPVISAYDPATKALTIDGLQASQTRTLEITYFIEASYMADLPFMNSVYMVVQYLLIIGLLALVIAVVINAFRKD